MQQDNGVLGAPIGCINPQYWFGGRTSSAKKSTLKKLLSWFWGSKNRFFFFYFSKNDAILRGMVNIRFLNAFRAPKSRFPAKYHISGHYIKNMDFWKIGFFSILGDFSDFGRFNYCPFKKMGRSKLKLKNRDFQANWWNFKPT